jgi:hypothetical protein
MATTRLKSFQHFLSIIQRKIIPNRTFAYRGVANAKHKLVPKVGRIRGYTRTLEKDILLLFKKHAKPFLKYIPDSEWEWLAIAQHYGLATRLLDWTENPLVAAYFAVAEDLDKDSAIYVLNTGLVLDLDKNKNPFKVSGDEIFIPDHIDARIIAQSGIFTIHSNPQNPFRRKTVEKLIIPNSMRAEFRVILFACGMHKGTLFPDLEGQAHYVNWLKGYGQ